MGRAQLATDIWRACDVMRRDNNCGGVLEYLEHLSWVLFLKFLDEQEELFEKAAKRRSRSYRRLIKNEFRWSSWVPKALGTQAATGDRSPGGDRWDDRRLIGFVRSELVPYLSSLSGRPALDIIASIFGERNVVICASAANLREVLRTVDGIDFRNTDDIHTVSHVYEELLRKLGNENKVSGEFHTPRPVIRFMVEVADPQIGETVYDPACGACGFLAEAFEYMRQKERSTADHETLQSRTFYGQEKKAVPSLLGLMNLVLHGVSAPNLRRVNTLEEDLTVPSEGHDVILTNPPFGGRENSETQRHFPVKANATELLFLQHVMEKVKRAEGGRCALVLPDGALFRNGAFATVRKKLIESFDLSLVVCLAPGAFAPYSDVKTAILFFRWPGPTTEVLYHEVGPPEPSRKFSRTAPISEGDFDSVRMVWRQWRRYRSGRGKKPALPADSFTRTADQIAQNGYDLSLSRPVASGEAAMPPPGVLVAELARMNGQLQDTLVRLQKLLTEREEP